MSVRRWVPFGLLSVLLVGLVVACLVVAAEDPEVAATPTVASVGGDAPTTDGQGAAAIVVAREAATDFFTLAADTVDEDLARLGAISTDEFRTTYETQAAKLRKEVVDKGLVLTADLPEDTTATEYLSATEARVLVAVDVTTTTRDGGTDDGRYRTRVSLQWVDGTWRVAGIDQVG